MLYAPEVRGDGVRYQGAVVRGQWLLLIQYQPRSGEPYWLLPGGGREDETPEECVARELQEETGLCVQVEQLLLEEPVAKDTLYRTRHTYLCSAAEGDARPGSEPGMEYLGFISAVRWFDLADEGSWGAELVRDPITYAQVAKIRAMLGYG